MKTITSQYEISSRSQVGLQKTYRLSLKMETKAINYFGNLNVHQ